MLRPAAKNVHSRTTTFGGDEHAQGAPFTKRMLIPADYPFLPNRALSR